MRSIIAIVVLMLCVAAQAAEIRGSIQVVVTTNASVALVPATGQTVVYQTGDNGTYQSGVVWPNPRFTIQANTNCVLDNLTGLTWTRNARPGTNAMTWSNAIVYCENLDYGGTNDWRLPTLRELYSLIDVRFHNPMLCNTAGTGKWAENDPFVNLGVGVDSIGHCTSTSRGETNSLVQAWGFPVYDGVVLYFSKTSTRHVWPVRGGR